MVIDLDNSSNPYLCVNFARQYGMHPDKILENAWLADSSRYIN
jgi:hypothetical protein